jgi:hypothetical protein
VIPEPFAFSIYREHLAGKSIEQLSLELGIPRERIAVRLQAVRHHLMAGPRSSADGANREPRASTGSSKARPTLAGRDHCARCGGASDNGSFCSVCRGFFATLSADSARRAG